MKEGSVMCRCAGMCRLFIFFRLGGAKARFCACSKGKRQIHVQACAGCAGICGVEGGALKETLIDTENSDEATQKSQGEAPIIFQNSLHPANACTCLHTCTWIGEAKGHLAFCNLLTPLSSNNFAREGVRGICLHMPAHGVNMKATFHGEKVLLGRGPTQ